MNFCAVFGFDVLCLICEKFEVSDVKSFYNILRSICIYRKDLKSIDKVLAFRFNPVCYFGIAFNDLLLLLLAIISHGIIFLGFRATDFFYPDFRDIESDWSFSITADTKYIISAVKALEQYEVLWKYKASEIIEEKLNNISTSKQSIIGYFKGYTVINGNKHTVILAR